MDRIEEFSVPNQIQFHLGGHPPTSTWGGRSCARTIGLDKSVHFRSRTEHKKCPIVCRGWLSGRAAASDRPTKPGAVGIHHHVTAHFSLETAKSTFGMKYCFSEPQMGLFFMKSQYEIESLFLLSKLNSWQNQWQPDINGQDNPNANTTALNQGG